MPRGIPNSKLEERMSADTLKAAIAEAFPTAVVEMKRLMPNLPKMHAKKLKEPMNQMKVTVKEGRLDAVSAVFLLADTATQQDLDIAIEDMRSQLEVGSISAQKRLTEVMAFEAGKKRNRAMARAGGLEDGGSN